MKVGWFAKQTVWVFAVAALGSFLAVARLRAPRFTVAWSVPALLGLMLLPVFGDTSSWVLWGGFLALALSALVLLYAATSPAWLEHRVLLRIADVSFGIYLWHYVFVRSDIPLWVAAVATTVAAIASWWLVEQPLVRWDAGRRARRAEPGKLLLPTPTPSVVD